MHQAVFEYDEHTPWRTGIGVWPAFGADSATMSTGTELWSALSETVPFLHLHTLHISGGVNTSASTLHCKR